MLETFLNFFIQEHREIYFPFSTKIWAMGLWGMDMLKERKGKGEKEKKERGEKAKWGEKGKNKRGEKRPIMIINKGKYLEVISLSHFIQIFKIVIDFTSFVSLMTFIRGKNIINIFPFMKIY